MNPIETWLTEPEGLATRLRALRTQAGLTGLQLAGALGWQQSKVSKLENGRQMPSPADIEAWTRVCGVGPEVVQELLRQLEHGHAVHLDWKRRLRGGQASVQESYNDLVRAATSVRYFDTIYVPGFLQTNDYARAILTESATMHGVDTGDIDAAVAARMQRQQLLYEQGKQFEFLLFEPVLRWRPCSAEAMRAQLDRLQTIIGVPNIRFGILPLGIQLRTTPQNSFQLYDDLAVVETFIGETRHTGDEATSYGRVLEQLWNEAVTDAEARRLIVAAAEEL